MMQFLQRYPVLVLFISLSISFSFHAYYLLQNEIGLGTYLTWQAYLINGILAAAIIFLLARLPKRWQGNQGFVFMIGSAIKFAFFFIFFYPFFKEDGEIQSIEFASFFLPYAISLSVKTLLLLSKLNSPSAE